MPENPYVSGIFSMAGRRHMGTSLTEILKNHPDYIKNNGGINYRKIAQTIKEIKKVKPRMIKRIRKSNLPKKFYINNACEKYNRLFLHQ